MLVLSVVLVLTTTACWPMFRFEPDRSGSSPDRSISLDAVASGSLVLNYTSSTGGPVRSSPAVANGVAYVGSDDNKLYAFDAAGTTNCSGSPKSCTPLWTATTGDVVVSSPAVVNGVVYVGSRDHKLYAFDAAGNTNCSGTPKACGPLWTATTGGAVSSSPTVVNGVVYVGSNDNQLYAFDAMTGSPLWTAATGGAVSSSPAVDPMVSVSGSAGRQDQGNNAHGAASPPAASSATPSASSVEIETPDFSHPHWREVPEEAAASQRAAAGDPNSSSSSVEVETPDFSHPHRREVPEEAATSRVSPRSATGGATGGPLVVDPVVSNVDPNLKNTDTSGGTEPGVAVNPANPSQVAINSVSGQWGPGRNAPLWYSADAGSTWTKEFTIPPPPGRSSTGCPCDQTFDYGRDGTLFGTFLTTDFSSFVDVVSGDTADPASASSWQWNGNPVQLTDNAHPGNADQPWLLVNRDPSTAAQDDVWVAYEDFSANPPNAQVAVSKNAIPPNFALDASPGAEPNSLTNPSVRLAKDSRNGAMYALWQTTTGTTSPHPTTLHVNRSTDGGATWTLNGSSGGLSLPAGQADDSGGQKNVPTYKFGTVNALIGGVHHLAVDPANGDVYVAYGNDNANDGTGNQILIRRLTDNGSGGLNVGSAVTVSGATSSALPSVAVLSDGTVGVLYDTFDGFSTPSSYPIFSAHLARSTDHGRTFSDVVLEQFLSPSKDNGSVLQRVLGDYQQLKAQGNQFFGVFSGNRVPFNPGGTSIIDPISFTTQPTKLVFVGSNDNKLYAFDAAGSAGCSGIPKTCSPLWTATTGGSVSSSPAVINGVAYVGSNDNKLYAFDAAGSAGCSGIPKTCSPLWTATTGGSVSSSPAVANGVVYVGSNDNKLYAFATNTGNPLWTAGTGGSVSSSPAVANGVVYVGSNDNKLYAFDAAGSSGCSGTPKTCSPLETATTGGAIASSPAVANGAVYVGSNDNNLYAYGLEKIPPTTSIVIPSNGATLSGTTTLDAKASDDVKVSRVEYHLTGGSINDALIATATPTQYGWVAQWNTTSVPNGAYTLNSVAFDPAGNVGRSADLSITVQN